jgi:hypothetical protein
MKSVAIVGCHLKEKGNKVSQHLLSREGGQRGVDA